MSKTRYLQLMAGAAFIALAIPAAAHNVGDLTRISASALASAEGEALGIAVQSQKIYQEARRGRGADDADGDDHGRRGRGADDPAGDDRGGARGGHGADDPAGDDRGGARGGRGADDPAGDDRGGGRGKGGHGADDGPNHASSISEQPFMMARHGADDAAGDDRGGGKGRKGGRDDAAGHA